MAWGGGRTYKHGVLVANWHEDEAGLRLAAQPASNYNPKTHYLTETTAHYRPPGPETLIDNYYAKLNARGLSGVNGSQLFRHAGADSYESRYLTTYSTANHAVALNATRKRATSALGTTRSAAADAAAAGLGDSAAGAGAGATLRSSVSAGGPRSPSRLQTLQQLSGSPQSARSPPRVAADAAALEPAPGAARAPQSSAASSAAPGDVKAAALITLPKPNIFHTVRAPYHQQFSSAKPQVPQAQAQAQAFGSADRLGAVRPGPKAGKPRSASGAAIPRAEVTPESVRAGDLSIEYAAFTIGGRKKPFPTVPDPSLALDRFAGKIDTWRVERDGSLRTRTYESEHAGSFTQPAAVAARQQAAASAGGAAAQALGVEGNPFATSVSATGAAAGAKTAQFARDAQGNPRTNFHKHQQFKVAHDWGALRLRS